MELIGFKCAKCVPYWLDYHIQLPHNRSVILMNKKNKIDNNGNSNDLDNDEVKDVTPSHTYIELRLLEQYIKFNIDSTKIFKKII